MDLCVMLEEIKNLGLERNFGTKIGALEQFRHASKPREACAALQVRHAPARLQGSAAFSQAEKPARPRKLGTSLCASKALRPLTRPRGLRDCVSMPPSLRGHAPSLLMDEINFFMMI
ncbi:hypothetical protein TIFTF001_029890 [Ficus carica]|uniref:Uncharacterized protein n=1 Tax=Ficus carica TaxID=3494 RepID=A0AA88DSF0_FICCA|nr:hypothetical protein TIFTF001_029890 [Ficus carica]